MKRIVVLAILAVAALGIASLAGASVPGADVRLTHDNSERGGYISSFTIGTGAFYTDDVLRECSMSRGRQNEPSVSVDPRTAALPDAQKVLIGSSNDYCGVYAGSPSPPAAPVPAGPIWLGYYRSVDGGASFVSSLVPGYPGDTSPYAQLSQVRTSDAGDPVIAWDAQGRVFLGSESSGDPAGTKKTFGDVFVARYVNPSGLAGPTSDDGRTYEGSTVVDRGSSAPNLLGQFNDKTTIQADHNTDGRCDNFVYFGYSRFQGGSSNNSIQFTRSTDHGVSFSQPQKISDNSHNVQFPEVSVTGSSNVYVTFRQFTSKSGQPDAVVYVKSTDCGATFSKPVTVTTFEPYDAQDLAGPAAAPRQTGADDPVSSDRDAASGTARDCGDFASACKSGYTFFRRDTQVRSAGDQYAGAGDNTVYVLYDPSKPGTEVPTLTTYGSIQPGTGSQSGIYFLKFDGLAPALPASGSLVDDQATGHQLFPAISADTPRSSTAAATILHALWWDSRLDACYSPMRPVGNCPNRSTVQSLDSFGSTSANGGATWTGALANTRSSRISDVTSNPNYEQFGGRTVPFAGDYLWVTSLGTYAYGVWTDWRNTVAGVDQREGSTDSDADGADVLQCRTVSSDGTVGSDTCPRLGGLDQNIYGDLAP